MFCPKCGTSNPDNARFCAGCGSELPRPAAPAAGDASTAVGAASAPVTPPPAGVAAPAPAPGAAPAPGPMPGAAPVPGPAPAPAPGAGSVPPAGWGATPPRKGLSKGAVVGIVAGAGLVVLALVALLFFTLCGSRGNGSPQQMCERLTEATQRVFDEGLDAAATQDFLSLSIDMVHPDVVDAMMAYEGYATREELAEDISGYSDDLSLFGGVMDYIDVDVSIYQGDQLSSDDLSEINDQLSSLGLSISATDGYELDMDTTMTLTQDLYGTPAGTTETSDSDPGVSVIQIDGLWYLWADSWNY